MLRLERVTVMNVEMAECQCKILELQLGLGVMVRVGVNPNCYTHGVRNLEPAF